jgi:hypothetical protein
MIFDYQKAFFTDVLSDIVMHLMVASIGLHHGGRCVDISLQEGGGH